MRNLNRIKKKLLKISLIAFVIFGCIQCATSQKIDKELPVAIQNAYYQRWSGGARGSGHGYNIYIALSEDENIQLDKAYFGEEILILEKKQRENVYVGTASFRDKQEDFVMSLDVKKEAQNKIPNTKKEKSNKDKNPFNLKDKECVIAYTKDGKKGYFKIDNLKEKEVLAYPMAPNSGGIRN